MSRLFEARRIAFLLMDRSDRTCLLPPSVPFMLGTSCYLQFDVHKRCDSKMVLMHLMCSVAGLGRLL